MTTILPTLPRLVMCYIEPLTLLAGALVPALSPNYFIPSQLPPHHLTASQLSQAGAFTALPTEEVLNYQIANLYALLMMLGLGILNTTTEPRVVHVYVVALAIADVGHLGATAAVMGWEGVAQWREWNATMWGNLGVVVFLFATRVGYLVGWLGEDRVLRGEKGRRGGKVKGG